MFDFEPDTAAYLAQSASQPARENLSLDELRSSYRAALIAESVKVDGVSSVDFEVPAPSGAMTARLYVPDRAPDATGALLYVHGGGFAVGDLDSHDKLARLIAASGAFKVVTFAYRRAPENPFPAGRDDAVAAFRFLASAGGPPGIDRDRIALGGESAGAAHAAAAALVLRDDQPGPAALWLMSPALDATASGQSYRDYATGAGRTAAEFAYLWSLYAPDISDHKSSEVSPLFAELAGLPETYLYPAGIDPARSDGEVFAERARAAGVPVFIKVRDGLVHQYPELTGVSLGSRRAVEQAAVDLRPLLA